ncbi:MAG: uncharacterized protein QOD01_691 [Actinomycetota bacterium]|nr:uncharacterized protein [Actinomycetota bacterium]
MTWGAAVANAVYPLDNHSFLPGTGPSAPAEYEPVQHMDPAVVGGIASWLTSGGLGPEPLLA